MGPVPGREALEAMKRVDIQKLCKDYGVKANLKTEALIDLLLDASRPAPPRSNPTQPSGHFITGIPRRPGSRRSSLIIHSDSTDALERDTSSRPANEDQSTPLPPLPLPPPQPTRTRKARESQYRLGVGRPVVAGGGGARAVTKSISTSRRLKRAKSGTAVEPSEATITEEPEPEEHGRDSLLKGDVTGNASNTNNSPLHPDKLPPASQITELVQTAVVKALAPMQKELDSQKSQLAELKDKVTCMITSFEARIRVLTSEIDGLRAKAKDATTINGSPEGLPSRIPQPPSTPKRVWSPHRTFEKDAPSELSSDSTEPGTLALPGTESSINSQPTHIGTLLPGFTHSTLGKRGRDPASWEDEEFHKKDGLSETELELRMGKRPKLRTEDRVDGSPTQRGKSELATGRAEETEAVDEPGPSSPVVNASTNTTNNVENVNPFNFGFVPSASTPAQAAFPLSMGSFPFPEPPTSPSPANAPERPHSDTLGPFGPQRMGRRSNSGRAVPQTHGETSGSAGLQRMPSSNDVASQIGLTAIRTAATDPGTPLPPAERTMYGTELDGETRFGDFGVGGVASGFWIRDRY